MALIDIPTKNPDSLLSSLEFNQLLDALKNAIRGINTLDVQSSTATFSGAVNFLGPVDINGEAGPFSKFWEGQDIIYVSKSGGVYDGVLFDGKSPGKSLSSFQDAIDNVNAIHGQVPSETNPMAIFCIDGGLYEEGITTIPYLSVFAPMATLKLGGANEHQLVVKNCHVSFADILRDTGTNDMITMSAASGCSHIACGDVNDSGSGTALAQTTSEIAYVDIKRIAVLGGGIGISDDSTVSSHMHIWLHSIVLASNNAIGIKKSRPGSLFGYVDGLSYDGIVTGTTGILQTDGTISMSLIELKAHTAINVNTPGTLNIYSNKVTGATIGTGVIDVVTPGIISTAINSIDNKEDSLGNPAVNNQVLTSLTNGTRSWATSGDMARVVYDPTNVLSDAFNHENHHGDYIDIGTDIATPAYTEGRLSWNDEDNTLNVATGLNGTSVQVGQESVRKIYNNTGAVLENGKVVHYLPMTTNGHPHAEYAIADSYETLQGSLSVVTGDIPPGAYGFSTFFGKVRGVDTSGIPVGVVYLSDTVPGELTNIKPMFPSYAIYMGAVNVSDAVNGEIIVSQQSHIEDTILNSWNGSIREPLDFRITSNGTTITGALEQTGGGDLTLLFSDGITKLDCTPPKTIVLTPGTNSIPVKNYVYIPISTKVLTLSTVDWPAEEHIRVADCVLQSASYTNLYGAFSNRNWNDHIQGTNGSGDLIHISQWIRNQSASWLSGVQGIVTVVNPTTLYFSSTSGKVYQKHPQTFNATNQGTGTPVFVVNDPVTPYSICTNLTQELTDANNVSMATRFYNIVIWGVNSKSGEQNQIMMNLPRGSYGTLADAVNDVSNFDVYTIPSMFKGSGFLIARFTLKHANPSTWTLANTTDLRGIIGNAAGAGMGTGGATLFTSLTDTPSSYVGKAGDVPVVNGSETGIEFLAGVNGSFTTVDNKTVTVTNGIITSIV